MTDFHPSTGYHWKSAADVATGSSSPSLLPASTVDQLNTAVGPAKVGAFLLLPSTNEMYYFFIMKVFTTLFLTRS